MQSDKLLQALKQTMRSRGVSYRDAATALDLSESSIKRLFAENSFTLPRIEKLCELLDTDLLALAQTAESMVEKIDQLSQEQEQLLVDDPRLLLVGVCVINQCRFSEILEKYQFDEHTLIRLFAQLDKLKLIDLLPGNRYKLRLSRQFSWRSQGPIQKFLVDHLLHGFIAEGINPGQDNFSYLWGMLTPESANELQRKIQRLAEEFVAIANKDAKLPMKSKLTSSLMILFRPDWEPKLFQTMWRQQS